MQTSDRKGCELCSTIHDNCKKCERDYSGTATCECASEGQKWNSGTNVCDDLECSDALKTANA